MKAVTVAFLLMTAFPILVGAQQDGQVEISTTSNLTGTIRAINAKARTVVITGVGHALRLVRMQVGPGCRIRIAGAVGQLDDLRRGDIVRIHYRKAAEGNVAANIEESSDNK